MNILEAAEAIEETKSVERKPRKKSKGKRNKIEQQEIFDPHRQARPAYRTPSYDKFVTLAEAINRDSIAIDCMVGIKSLLRFGDKLFSQKVFLEAEIRRCTADDNKRRDELNGALKHIEISISMWHEEKSYAMEKVFNRKQLGDVR